MGKKIPNVQPGNTSLRVDNNKQCKGDVRSIGFDDYKKNHPVFLFNDFKLNSICIPGEFNNHYKDVDSYLRILSTLFGRGLELLSNETVKELVENSVKQSTMHFHKVSGKEEILRKILEEYGFSDNKIDDIIEGERIYQFEIPFENGAARVIFQVIERAFSLLFLDVNHHIYFNADEVKRANSLFYEECPVNLIGKCSRMEYLNTCFAFEFLDEEKIAETYGYSFHYGEKSN